MRWRVSGSIASPGTQPPSYPLFLFNCNYVALYEAAPLSEFLYSLYKITQQNGSILISPSTQIQNILHPSHPFGISCHPEMTPSSKENHCTVHSRMLDRHETTGFLGLIYSVVQGVFQPNIVALAVTHVRVVNHVCDISGPPCNIYSCPSTVS